MVLQDTLAPALYVVRTSHPCGSATAASIYHGAAFHPCRQANLDESTAVEGMAFMRSTWGSRLIPCNAAGKPETWDLSIARPMGSAVLKCLWLRGCDIVRMQTAQGWMLLEGIHGLGDVSAFFCTAWGADSEIR
jgi:hypothetical protein